MDRGTVRKRSHAGARSLRDPDRDEAVRWRAAGYELIFEELVMEYSRRRAAQPRHRAGRSGQRSPSGARHPRRELRAVRGRLPRRPGFPGFTPAGWITGRRAKSSSCPTRRSVRFARQARRVRGLWHGLVSAGLDRSGRGRPCVPADRAGDGARPEARSRMRRGGYRHRLPPCQPNNPAGHATWRHLGWRECGRRGRFERALTSDAADTT